MNYYTGPVTMDLRDLATELDELRTRAVTCNICKGEGNVPMEDLEGDGADTEGYCPKCGGDGEYAPGDHGEDPADVLPEDDAERLRELEALEGEFYTDLATFADNEPVAVSESTFESYAEQLAEDLGMIDSNAGWPLTCIDWERAADQLRQDYTSFTWENETWLVRSY